MRLYFAYGSNLSSARVQARVGEIMIEGVAQLPAHEHRFSKLGADGSGKGNVHPHGHRCVHGVLYRLSDRQFARLETFEGGYRRVEITVHRLAALPQLALTFVALAPGHPPPPSPAYLEHYRSGFVEHELPPAYARALLLDGGDDRPLTADSGPAHH